MKSMFKHIINNIREKKFRTAIMIITVMLSTFIIFTSLSTNKIMNETYATMVQGTYGQATVMITKSTADAPFYEKDDLKISETLYDTKVDQLAVSGQTILNDDIVKITVMTTDLPSAEEIDLIAPFDKTLLKTIEKNEVIISEKTARTYDLKAGDWLTISVLDETRDVTIGAVSETTGVYFGEIDRVLFVASDGFFNSDDQNTYVTMTLLKVPDANVNDVINEISTINTDFHVTKARSDQVIRDEETFQIATMIAILMIIFLSGYVIFSFAKIIMIERIPVVGTFRSLGASKRKIYTLLSLEFLCYGFIGALLGTIIAVFSLPSIAEMFNEYKQYGVSAEVRYDMLLIGLSFGIGSLLPVIISILQIFKVGNIPLKDLILQTPQTEEDHTRLRFIIGILLLGGSFALWGYNQRDDFLIGLLSILFLFIAIVCLIPIILKLYSKLINLFSRQTTKGELTLSIKNMGHNKIVANNMSLILIVFLLLLMIGMTSTGIENYLQHSLTQDYDISIEGMTNESIISDRLGQLEHVKDFNVQQISGARYNNDGDVGNFSVISADDLEEMANFYHGIKLRENAIKQMENVQNGIIIDEYQAKKYDLEIGDRLTLQPLDSLFEPIEDVQNVEVSIAGLMESSSIAQNRETVIVHRDFFDDHFENLFGRVAVKVTDPKQVEETKKTITQSLIDMDVSVITFEEMIEGQKGMIDALIIGIIVVILLGFLIGVLGISNNIIVSIIQRQKEFAVLHSTSMSKRQLIRMLTYEMLLTFGAVVFIGWLGGLALKIVMTKMLYGIGLRLDFTFDVGLYILLCGAVLLLLGISIIPVVNRMRKMNTMQALRYE